VVTGLITNPDERGSLPNFVGVTGLIPKGNTTSNAFLYVPSAASLRQGLDGLRTLPGRSVLTISGTYEADQFAE
jgi:hypothetical protein